MILARVEVERNTKSVMVHRPIFWGTICLLIGISGWFVSVILSVLTLGHFNVWANFFASIAYLGFPISIIWEIFLKIKNKVKK